MADTPLGETVTPGDSQTPVTTPATTPVVNAGDQAEVERLRKEAEQARMYANQLKNQLEAKAKAEAEAEAKKLEENEQFKDLWAAERAEKEKLLSEREEANRRVTLDSATKDLMKDYAPGVKELAETAGLKLLDDSETAISELKAKLDIFASKLGSGPKVTPNNPAPSSAPTNDREQQIKVMRMNNVPNSTRDAATQKAIGSLESVRALKLQAGLVEQ